MPIDIELTSDMLHYAFARAALRDLFHPSGAECPDCGAALNGQKQYFQWYQGLSVKCPHCNSEFTWRSNTPLAGKSADERQLILIIALTRYGRPQAEIAAACSMSVRTVRRYQRMIETAPQ